MSADKAIVTKLHEELNNITPAFNCSECDGQFCYGPGFPDFCPECGVEFESTDTVWKDEK